jgi:hypothetical protein
MDEPIMQYFDEHLPATLQLVSRQCRGPGAGHTAAQSGAIGRASEAARVERRGCASRDHQGVRDHERDQVPHLSYPVRSCPM